jgi:site-specific DNA-cytosine methylase
MIVVSAFDGISVARHALDTLGIVPEYYLAYEVDKYVEVISENNYPDIHRMGSVLEFNKLDMPGKVDLLVGGSPCQGFSLQGLQKGLEDDRSKLVNQYIKMCSELKPKYFLLENVVMKQEIQNYISEALGVPPVMINSRSFLPQSRKRLYWTNIPLREVQQVEYDVRDWCPEGYMPGTSRKGSPRKVVATDVFGCITATYYKGIRADGRPLLQKGLGAYDEIKHLITKLPPELCERLQGLPEGYTLGVSNTQRYKALGNAFTSPVIQHILTHLKEA